MGAEKIVVNRSHSKGKSRHWTRGAGELVVCTNFTFFFGKDRPVFMGGIRTCEALIKDAE